MFSQLNYGLHCVVHAGEVNFVAKKLTNSLHASLLLNMVLVKPLNYSSFNILITLFKVVLILWRKSLREHQISRLALLQAQRRFGIFLNVGHHLLDIVLLLIVPFISILSFFWHMLNGTFMSWRIELTVPSVDFGSYLVFLQSFSIEVIYGVSKLFD